VELDPELPLALLDQKEVQLVTVFGATIGFFAQKEEFPVINRPDIQRRIDFS
jgi:hypothetical protein